MEFGLNQSILPLAIQTTTHQSISLLPVANLNPAGELGAKHNDQSGQVGLYTCKRILYCIRKVCVLCALRSGSG